MDSEVEVASEDSIVSAFYYLYILQLTQTSFLRYQPQFGSWISIVQGLLLGGISERVTTGALHNLLAMALIYRTARGLPYPSPAITLRVQRGQQK